jgi:hypothetical protein
LTVDNGGFDCKFSLGSTPWSKKMSPFFVSNEIPEESSRWMSRTVGLTTTKQGFFSV